MRTFRPIILGLFMIAVAGCVHRAIPTPAELIVPEPIAGNTGEYMCPYTSDGVIAEWVDKAVQVKAGSSIGGMAGSYAAGRAVRMIPFVGGFMGDVVGESVGREIAIKAIGGSDFIKSKSDISFNSLEEMAVYLYVKYSSHEHYKDALDAVMQIYPEMGSRYSPALQNAKKKVS